ncbi:MAG: FtsW/RodA/SpoVE family cell cycle protein [Bacteroidales bacterium]|nr:FtsW/RodA/SpoVE family cell cycle protein [Bacteroidales bacterium]
MAEVVNKYFKGDRIIWGVILIFSIFSLLAVYSSTGSLAYKYQGGNTSYYILKHATFLVIGLILIFIIHLIPYKYFSRFSQFLLLIAIPLLVITLILGTRLNEASRWLTLPGLGFTFQTSDLAKLALVMYLARGLSLKQNNIKEFEGAFLPLFIPVVIVCMLILPENLSTAVILFGTSLTIMFIGRVSIKYILAAIMLIVLIISIFILITLKSEKEGRISTWKHRIENYMDKDSEGNFQVDQSKIAISTGGLFGKGPGNSVQRNFLPHPYSDFIYAIIIEEYGFFLGGLVIVFLYLFLLFRAGVIVRKSTRTFPAFLAIGLSMLLVSQAFVNMAVAVDLIPVTGQPLPMVSMGGSSMLFTCTALGIILSVSRGIRNEKTENDEGSETI